MKLTDPGPARDRCRVADLFASRSILKRRTELRLQVRGYS